MIIEEIKNIKDTVRDLLLKDPHLKDDDYKLISTIWWLQIKESANNITAMDLLKLHANKKLVCSESIRRCRALLQKQEPLLRGYKYKQRKNGGKDFGDEINKV